MKFVETPHAPSPRGHYSQAVIANQLVFVSGILPIIPNTTREMPIGMEAQTEQALSNLESILLEAKSSLNHLVSVQVFIPDMTFWEVLNDVYAKWLKDHKPARTVIPCGTLSGGALLEINAVAQLCS